MIVGIAAKDLVLRRPDFEELLIQMLTSEVPFDHRFLDHVAIDDGDNSRLICPTVYYEQVLAGYYVPKNIY
jgi:hypothetical protein